MTLNPLTVVWPNGNGATVSSRWAKYVFLFRSSCFFSCSCSCCCSSAYLSPLSCSSSSLPPSFSSPFFPILTYHP
jgi:hypothetical protein